MVMPDEIMERPVEHTDRETARALNTRDHCIRVALAQLDRGGPEDRRTAAIVREHLFRGGVNIG